MWKWTERFRIKLDGTSTGFNSKSEALREISNALTVLCERSDELERKLDQHAEDLVRLRRSVEGAVKREALNSATQVENYIGLLEYLRTGELPLEMHRWPISPDLGLFIINLLEFTPYDLAIEFGCGTSTTLIAKALKNVGLRQGVRPAPVYAFEHLEIYREKTMSQLHRLGLQGGVSVALAPLVPYTAPDGETYRYYDCCELLQDISTAVSDDARVFVFVDGPPGDTGKHARYPALPILYEKFKGVRIDLLLDDFRRQEEKDIVSKWVEFLNEKGANPEVVEVELEKGACLIKFQVAS